MALFMNFRYDTNKSWILRNIRRKINEELIIFCKEGAAQLISVGTNTLYDWWRGERTIQIIQIHNTGYKYTSGGAHNTNNFSRGTCQVKSTHRGNIFQIPKPKELFSLNNTNAFENGSVFYMFSNWKTDSRRNKCHLLSQKTLSLLSLFNLNFLSMLLKKVFKSGIQTFSEWLVQV